jgi:hypothetical protein
MMIPIATGFYQDTNKPIAAQECTNWIPKVPETQALTRFQLKRTPGIELFTTAGTYSCRGQHVMGGIAYTVNGQTLYRINEAGTVTSIGTITGTSRVSMADNGTQLCIVVPGSTAYIYTVSGGLAAITDSDFTTTLGPSQQVVFKDGYFIHYNNDSAASNQPIFFISDLNDGTSYDPLLFGTAEADPDAITGLHVNKNQLYVCGSITIEPFQNVGGADFPFQRIPGATIQKGCRAQNSLIDASGTWVFVGGGEGESSAIWAGNGQKLSTDAIDSILQSYTEDEISSIYTTSYAELGSYFVIIHMNDRTFAYDFAASAKMGKPVWHERKSKDIYGRLTNWRVNSIIDCYGMKLVGDNQGPKIGAMKDSLYTEYGDSINRVVSGIPLYNEGRKTSVAEFELLCQSGTVTATGNEPHVSRSFSDDGGYTFGNETSRSLGKQGEYKKRQIWRKEGQFQRYRVYKYVIDEPIDTAIFGLQMRFA